MKYKCNFRHYLLLKNNKILVQCFFLRTQVWQTNSRLSYQRAHELVGKTLKITEFQLFQNKVAFFFANDNLKQN